MRADRLNIARLLSVSKVALECLRSNLTHFQTRQRFLIGGTIGFFFADQESWKPEILRRS